MGSTIVSVGAAWRRRTIERRTVWLLGSPRSGSTWLLKMLADASGVTGLDEPLIGLHLSPWVCDRPGSVAADLKVSNCTFPRLAGGGRGYFFNSQTADVWAGPLGRLIGARFAAHAPRGLVAVKEPNGSQAADLLLRAMPRSRLLFLLRDGRDVADSELAAHTPGAWMTRKYPFRGILPNERAAFLDDAARKWVWQTTIVSEAFDHHRGPKLLVRYEKLRADPAPELERILRWLGVSDNAETLVARHAFERQKTGPSEFVRSASPGAWRKNLDVDEQRLIEQVMAETLLAHGYELSTAAPPSSPAGAPPSSPSPS